MEKSRKILFSALTALLMVALIISAVFLYLPKKSQVAYAARGKDYNIIDDIWIGGEMPFNANNLSILFSALTGIDNATINDVDNLLKNDTDGNSDNTTVSSDYFRSLKYNGLNDFSDGYNISVNFAGIKWDVVYLTTVRDSYSGNVSGDIGKPQNAGDIVVTLWQSADNMPSEKVSWASFTENKADVEYPCNMYSTSKIRVETLNNGGYYSLDSNTLSEEIEQDENNKFGYARFTMPNSATLKNSVRDYLVQPKDIAYQEAENVTITSNEANTMPNDAYGTPQNAKWYGKDRDYGNPEKGDQTKPTTMYRSWKEDYLWLPSLSEVGNINNDTQNTKNGIWHTNISLRCSDSNFAWLRSGGNQYVNRIQYIQSNGSRSYVAPNAQWYVRPALHLNLTKAAAKAGVSAPQIKGNSEYTYNGNEQTFTLDKFNNNLLNLEKVQKDGVDCSDYTFINTTGEFKVTNSGVYTLIFKPSNGNVWAENGKDDEKTITFTINKAKIGEDWTGDFAKLQEHVYHPDGTTYRLALPDVDDKDFPLSLVDKPAPLSLGDITIKYIIETHKESDHESFEKNFDKENLTPYSSMPDDAWTEYSKGGKCKNGEGEAVVDFDTGKPLGYCVIFKAEAGDNFETLYGYFSVHIFTEKLTINLSSGTIFADIEYGEVAHTQGSLRTKIFADIPDVEGIVVLDEDGSVKEDRTTAFKDETDKFEFYYSDGSTTYDIADLDDGTRLEAGKTYYLYVKYVGEPGVDGSENYITFDWKPGRPSFEIVPREIEISLTVTGSHKYNDTPPTSWATATPSRTKDGGTWYGKSEDNDVNILKLKYKFKKSDGTGEEYTALSKDMPAGTYNITVESGNVNYVIKATAPAIPTYEVKKGDYSITFGDLSAEYTGAEIPCEISDLPDGVSATYSYKGKGATIYDESPTAPTNAGTYEVTAKFTTTDSNYNAPDDMTAELTIEKISLSFTLKQNTGEYTGLEHSGIDVDFETLADGESLTKGVDYDLSFAVDGEGALGAGNLPQDKGSYTVTVILKPTVINYVMADGAEATYSITLGGIAKPEGTNINDTYKGADYELKLTGFDDNTMNGSASLGAQFDPTSGKFTAKNVGTYTLTISLADKDNTQWDTGDTDDITFTITIYKATISFTLNSASGKYTGLEHTGIDITFTGAKDTLTKDNDYTLTFAAGTGKLGSTDLPQDAGTYTVTVALQGDADNNYNLVSDTATYTVTADGIEQPKGTNINDIYKGADYELELTGFDDDAMTGSASLGAQFDPTSGKFTAKNVGTYTLTISLADKDNTQWDTGDTDDITFTITISKAKLTFTISPSSGVYNGAEHSVAVDFTKSLKGADSLSADDYEISYAVSPSGSGALGLNSKPQGVGTYTVTVTLKDTAATKNYEMADGASATYTVSAGSLEKPNGNDVGGTYNGSDYTLTVTGYDKDKMSYSVTGNGAAFNENTCLFTAKNAGTYTLNITIKNSNEYVWSGDGKTQFTITIGKAQLTVTAEDKNVVYGVLPTYTVAYSGFIVGENETNLNYTATASSAYSFGDGIGNNFIITVNAPQTLDNYNVVPVNGTLTVTRKTITLKINDGGHTHGSAPQSSFTLTDVNGGLVGSDTTAVFDGLITFYVKSNGVRAELDSSLAVGEYDLCADNGNYGNYTVTFTSGKYTVSNDSITAPTADTNEYTYTGGEITYTPEGFDPLTMDIEENVQTEAGEYIVKVYPKDENVVFDTAEGTKDYIEFNFVINPAEIVKLNDNGNSFIQDEVEGGGETPFAVTLGRKSDGKFANFDTVGEQEITIYATLPMPYDNGAKPARPEFDGLSRNAAYIDITGFDVNDPDYPLNVDVKKVGKYVVYYRIVAPNHTDLDGEWRVEVAKDSEVVKVVFKKAYEIPYGVTPDPAEIFEDIKAMPAQYLSITKGGADFTSTFFDEIAQGVTLGCRRVNEFGKYSDSGEYYINFTLDGDSVYTVIYRDGGNNPEEDTNFDKFKITQRKLALIWDSSKLKYTFTGETIALDGLATLQGAMADDWDDLQVRFELPDHSQVITAEGEYQVTAVLVGANARNYCFADEDRVTNTVVVTAPLPDEQTENDDGGIPWWVWIIVGVGVALVVAVIIVIVVKKKKSKGGDDNAPQTPAPDAAAAEPQVIYRDGNYSDDDGFYDDVTDDKNG